MSSMTKRLSIALASTALVGGALLGAGGSASAATAMVPAQHVQYVSVQAADHKSEATSFHGVTAARWYQGQVDDVTSSHSVVITPARWYQDQVEWSLTHR
ncbi:hypothetical protein ABT275_39000 [Streptomyces sp. NPDC001185]|uniref:hypothetical protein n=1 Tax=Streptomyces sp. NPDC001185 TaxID=3154380 RepID=UPI00332C76F9